MSRPLAPRRILALSGAVALALAALGGLLVRLDVVVRELDGEWRAEVLEEQGPWFELPARFLDWVGGGWVAIVLVPVGLAIALLVARRPWSALALVLASAAGAGVVQGLKALFGRARPEDGLLELGGGSYPSGHVGNAAVLAVVLVLLVRRAAAVVVGAGYVVAMALARTYLGVHWITDTLGGLLAGAGAALLVGAALLPRLDRERAGPGASVGSVSG